MKSAIYNITLDIHKTGSQVFLPMFRGDTSRTIIANLTENGKPYDIVEGCTVVFTGIKEDGNALYNDCTIDFENNTITYKVTSQTTAVSGMVNCQIKLIGYDGGILTSPSFAIVVQDTVYNEEPIVESSEEFNALTNYLASLEKKLADGEFKGDKGDKGDIGESVTVSSVTESTADSGSNVVTFSDGKSVTIKNGSKGSKGDAGNDGKDADVSELAPAIVCTTKGAAVAITDSSESGFEAFSIYGKSTQDGTPTPDAPVDIVSVGEDGKIITNIYGKNIIEPIMASGTINGITITNNKDGSFTLNGTSTNNASFRIDQTTVSGADKLKSYKGRYYISLRDANGNTNPQGLALYMMQNETYKVVLSSTVRPTADVDTTKAFLYIDVTPGITLSNLVVYPQLEMSYSMTDWERPIKQSVEFATTPLRAIPITDKSLATYTDANGQMWCADEIDLERGVYVQRIKQFSLKVADMNNLEDYPGWRDVTELTECFPIGTMSWKDCISNVINGVGINMSSINRVIYLALKNNPLTQTQWIANYPNLVCNFLFPLITPIETPLTAEQIAACKALHTNYPSTTISNDENAFMKVGYRADTKNFIKRMVGSTTQISSVTLAASKWVGTASPYSQVVTISGTTKNSKIDLNPTVEQLSIFHNKDLAFVVGNNNGVITVYAIGQKPTNDYTMQAAITEVAINE